MGTRVFLLVVVFSALFAAILFMLTSYLLKKFGKEPKGKRTKHIWVWRITIFLVIIYMISVLWLNKDALDMSLVGPIDFIVAVFLFVFFVTLVEISIIDLLLPDVLKMRHRIPIEILIFFLLGGFSILMFVVLSRMAGF